MLTRSLLIGAVAVLWAGAASATPFTYKITDIDQTGTGLAAFGVTTLASSTAGTGDITLSGLQIVSGTGSGASYVTNIDVAVLTQEVDITRTDFDIFAISSTLGDVTANGETGNTTCAGTGAGTLCGNVVQGPDVPWTWPVTDDGFGLPETATIANFVGNDTDSEFDVLVFSNLDLGDQGTVTVTETWHFKVPEPGAMLLLGTGLLGLLLSGRQRA